MALCIEYFWFVPLEKPLFFSVNLGKLYLICSNAYFSFFFISWTIIAMFFSSVLCYRSIHRATIDYSQRSSLKKNGLSPRRHSGNICFTVLMLRVASLLSALLALAAKENGIAALPIAITWDIIRLHQQSTGTSHDKDGDGSDRTARCASGGSKTSSSNSSSNSSK